MLSMNEQQAGSQAPGALTSPDELRKRVLKLRWIGMDDEAEQLSSLLARTTVATAVFIGPRDTD